MQIHQLNSVFLQIIGIWKPKKDRFYIFKLYNVSLTLLIFIFMMAQFVIMMNKDTEMIWSHDEAMRTGIVALMGLIKRINAIYQQKNITELIETVENFEPFKSKNQSEKNIQDSYHRFSKFIASIITLISATGTILYLQKEFNTHTFPILPFGTGILVGISNRFIYNLISWTLITVSFVGILIIVSYNMLFVTMMMIICCQVDLLKCRYKTMVTNIKITQNIHSKANKDNLILEKKMINDFVSNHSEVLELSKKICGIFSTITFMQYSYSTIGLCLSSYTMSRTIFLSDEFLSQLIIFVLFAIEISSICYISNKMKTQYEELHNVFYDVDWTIFNNSTKKSMMILMMKTREPFIFKCGKLFEPSRESLLTIFKLSYSIFSVVREL